MDQPIAENLIRFCRYLRSRGLPIAPQTASDLMAGARVVGWLDRDDLRAAFRSLVAINPEHRAVFDEAFELFFGVGERPTGDPIAFTALTSAPVFQDDNGLLDPVLGEEIADQLGASFGERLAERDFSELAPAEVAEVRRMIARMVWRPAETASRRWKPDPRGPRPDLRRTLRGTVGPRGELMELSFANRKPRRRPLIILADVSGSMERYAEMLLHFAHAAPARIGRVETFVFSTRLTRITHELRRRDPAAALRRVSRAVHDWSGGTRIGEALQTFNAEWSRRVGHGGPIGIIISDGWDRGDPELLAREMARFSRSVHRSIWLNPLAGNEGYSPETRGLKAALPHVDDFLPVGRLADLGDVVRLLESIPSSKSVRSERAS